MDLEKFGDIIRHQHQRHNLMVYLVLNFECNFKTSLIRCKSSNFSCLKERRLVAKIEFTRLAQKQFRIVWFSPARRVIVKVLAKWEGGVAVQLFLMRYTSRLLYCGILMPDNISICLSRSLNMVMCCFRAALDFNIFCRRRSSRCSLDS